MPNDFSQNNRILADLSITDHGFDFTANIESAILAAEAELREIDHQLTENLETIQSLTPNCDKTDYILAASCGALCGVMDIFLVGIPGESVLENMSDKWFEDRTKEFAKLCGWKPNENASLSSAIAHLEKKFDIPYDQRGAGDKGSWIYGLNPQNHHFKSLGHNPTLLGLFVSILDQFTNTSHFVSQGELIALQEANNHFVLRGNSIPAKLFAGFVNWFGHLISDMSGSSSSKNRGMGVPSPFWSWTNDLIVLKSKLHIPVTEFDLHLNELALTIYNKGYDARFQATQAIPVFINELLVRTVYSVRRFMRCYSAPDMQNCAFPALWTACEPFSNATVKRMLTVAHGAFVLVDSGDALARAFAKASIPEFCMRLNIIGVGRFTISLYGEASRVTQITGLKEDSEFLYKEKAIVTAYLSGLRLLADVYDDRDLITFVHDFENSVLYDQAFKKSVLLADKRAVPEEKVLRSKADIDSYFTGGKV